MTVRKTGYDLLAADLPGRGTRALEGPLAYILVSLAFIFLVIPPAMGADSGALKGTPAGRAADKAVTIDFDGVDIVVFIKFISELTGKNFVIDSAVRPHDLHHLTRRLRHRSAHGVQLRVMLGP